MNISNDCTSKWYRHVQRVDRKDIGEMGQDVTAAKRHFPNRAQAIEDLAARDEEFRSLCRDFADAGAELIKWENSADPKHDQRYAEYLALVGELANEIGAAIDAAVIIPFHRP